MIIASASCANGRATRARKRRRGFAVHTRLTYPIDECAAGRKFEAIAPHHRQRDMCVANSSPRERVDHRPRRRLRTKRVRNPHLSYSIAPPLLLARSRHTAEKQTLLLAFVCCLGGGVSPLRSPSGRIATIRRARYRGAGGRVPAVTGRRMDLGIANRTAIVAAAVAAAGEASSRRLRPRARGFCSRAAMGKPSLRPKRTSAPPEVR